MTLYIFPQTFLDNWEQFLGNLLRHPWRTQNAPQDATAPWLKKAGIAPDHTVYNISWWPLASLQSINGKSKHSELSSEQELENPLLRHLIPWQLFKIKYRLLDYLLLERKLSVQSRAWQMPFKSISKLCLFFYSWLWNQWTLPKTRFTVGNLSVEEKISILYTWLFLADSHVIKPPSQLKIKGMLLKWNFQMKFYYVYPA